MDNMTLLVLMCCLSLLSHAGADEITFSPSSTPTTPQPLFSGTPILSGGSAASLTVTLVPTTHWNHNSTDTDSLVPDKVAKIYHAPQGSGDIYTSHSFHWVNATLKYPAVVLDKSTLLSYTWSAASESFAVKFHSEDAYETAKSTWEAPNLLLIAYTPDCGNYDGGDSCYLSVDTVSCEDDERSCEASGTLQTLKQCMDTLLIAFGQYSAPSQPALAQATDAATSSVLASVVAKYPQFSAQLTSYFSNSILGFSMSDISATSSSTILQPRSADAVTSTATPATSTDDPDQPRGLTSGLATSQRQRVCRPLSPLTTSSSSTTLSTTSTSGTPSSALSGFGTSTITAPPSSSTSLPLSLSSISSSISSILSSLSSAHSGSGTSSSTGSSGGGSSTGRGNQSTIAPYGNSTTSATPTSSSTSTSNTTVTTFGHPLSVSITSSTASSTISGSSNNNTSTGVSSSVITIQSNGSSLVTANPTTITSVTTTVPSTTTTSCTWGFDPTWHLLSYCPGPEFDAALDAVDGFDSLSDPDLSYLIALFPNVWTSLAKRREGLDRRCLVEFFCSIGNDITSIGGGIVGSVTSFGGGVASTLTSAVGGAASTAINGGDEAVNAATSVVVSVLTLANGELINAYQTIYYGAGSVIQDITSVALSIQSEASAAGYYYTEEVSEAIAELLDGLTSLTAILKGAETTTFDLVPPDIVLSDSPWGRQLHLYSTNKQKEETKHLPNSSSTQTSTTDLDVSFYCVDCSVSGTLELEGLVEVTIEGFRQITVGADFSDLELSLGLGIEAEFTYTYTEKYVLVKEGIPDICSGTTFCIGPYVELDAIFTAEIDAIGFFRAGGKFSWTNAQFSVDLMNFGGTSSGWDVTPVPVIDAGASITLTTEFSLPLTVGLGFYILDDPKISAAVTVTTTPSLKGTAEAGLTADFNGTDFTDITLDTSSATGCDGISTEVDWEVAIDYNIVNFYSGTIYDTGPQPIFQECIPWNDFDPSTTSSSSEDNTTGFGPGYDSGNSTDTSSYTVVTELQDVLDNTALLICQDGNMYQSSSATVPSGCSSSFLGYIDPNRAANFDSQNGPVPGNVVIQVIGDLSGRIPVLWKNTIEMAQLSRLRFVDTNAIPTNSDFVQLAYDISNIVAGPSFTTLDQPGYPYIAVACQNPSSLVPGANQIFLVPTAATISDVLTEMNQGDFATTITNGNVTGCTPIGINLVQTGNSILAGITNTPGSPITPSFSIPPAPISTIA